MQWNTIAALLVLLGASAGASAASSIVYDSDGTYGYSMNQPSVTAATQQALQYCARRSRSCGQIVHTSNEGYSAIATGTVAMGFALGESSPEAAQRKAEKMCKARANDCTLAILWREEPPRAPQWRSAPAPSAPPHTLPPAPQAGVPVPEPTPGLGAPLQGAG